MGAAYRLCWCRWQSSGKFVFQDIFPPPLTKCSLVEMQPVLLGANDHTRTHESHVRNDLIGGKAIPVNEVCANEAACAAKPSLAVNRNGLVLDCDHVVRHSDELLDHMQRWAGPVVEDHVQVVDTESSEVCGRV